MKKPKLVIYLVMFEGIIKNLELITRKHILICLLCSALNVILCGPLLCVHHSFPRTFYNVPVMYLFCF